MVRPIVKDIFLLGQKSAPCTRDDLPLAKDLADTLAAHSADCAGMAANMIGVLKRAIVVGSVGVMFNPVIIKKEKPYEAEEGCLSLEGRRKAARYQKIEVEYMDRSWKKRRQSFTGYTAQVVQHECDHLDGVII